MVLMKVRNHKKILSKVKATEQIFVLDYVCQVKHPWLKPLLEIDYYVK